MPAPIDLVESLDVDPHSREQQEGPRPHAGNAERGIALGIEQRHDDADAATKDGERMMSGSTTTRLRRSAKGAARALRLPRLFCTAIRFARLHFAVHELVKGHEPLL